MDDEDQRSLERRERALAVPVLDRAAALSNSRNLCVIAMVGNTMRIVVG